MKLMTQDFKEEFGELKPQVQEKAIEIAEKLINEQQLDKQKAMAEGVRQAEQWFFDMEG